MRDTTWKECRSYLFHLETTEANNFIKQVRSFFVLYIYVKSSRILSSSVGLGDLILVLSVKYVA
jgi:hypothetical protein